MWAKLHDHATSFPSWGNTYIHPDLPTYIYIHIYISNLTSLFFLIPPPSREG